MPSQTGYGNTKQKWTHNTRLIWVRSHNNKKERQEKIRTEQVWKRNDLSILGFEKKKYTKLGVWKGPNQSKDSAWSQSLCRRAWTYLEAIALVHQESLSFGGVSHLLGVLWHQWIEVGIVLLSYHPWTGTQVEEGRRTVLLCSERRRRLCHCVPAWCKFFGFLSKQADLSWPAELCQASELPVCVIRHGRRSGSEH